MQDQIPVVNWPYWAQCATWTLEEAVALTLGLHPSKVIYAEDCLSPEAAVSFRRLAALVRRAMDSDELVSPLTPAAYLKWAVRRGITVVPELRKAVEDAVPKPPIVESAHPNFRLSSVATLVIGLVEVVVKPEERSSAPRLVSGRLRERGLNLSEDTIRDILRAYSEFVKRD